VVVVTADREVRATGAKVDFETFYRAQFPHAVRLAHLLTGSNLFAEDLAQDGLSRMQNRFDDIDDPTRYLHITMTNVCRNWHRGRFRERARLSRLTLGSEIPPHECEYLLALVDRLPYRQRAVLILRYWLDLPEAEIARVLGCRPGTVKSLRARALDRLRKELGE
jgi:RNA polymerase sigma factor (sigma-70 family)